MNDTCLRALSQSGAQPTFLNLSSTSISSLAPFDAEPAFSSRLQTLLLAHCSKLPEDALMAIVLSSDGRGGPRLQCTPITSPSPHPHPLTTHPHLTEHLTRPPLSTLASP